MGSDSELVRLEQYIERLLDGYAKLKKEKQSIEQRLVDLLQLDAGVLRETKQPGEDGGDDHRFRAAAVVQHSGPVRDLQEGILRTGRLEEEEFEFLERWLTGHILVADMRFGEYLLEAA